jgi:hypothetical protein
MDFRPIDIETRAHRSFRGRDRFALRIESQSKVSVEGGSAMSLCETASLSKSRALRARLAAVKVISVARSDITRPTDRDTVRPSAVPTHN